MSEIIKFARTTLLILNERGLAPTPDNYAKIYCEVSGDEYVPFVKAGAAETNSQSAPNKVEKAVKDTTKTTPVAKPASPPKTSSSGGVLTRKEILNPESFLLGRRPILHASQLIAGYELSLYAYGQQSANEFSIGELAIVLKDIGQEGVLQEILGFIPITLDDLLGTQISLLASTRMVLELADGELDETHIAKIIELKAKGFKFSLTEYFEPPASDVVIKLMDFVKFDIQATSNYELEEALKRL
ncbi:MAG: hypothetical protein K8Q92_02735, partial [Methylophilales bacterium]|nr:hypothetical protein [Methylophilales bacterium]